MVVYILFHETNSGSSESDSDGYVEAVYATEAAAQEAMIALNRAAVAEGKAVYFVFDDPEAEAPADWTDDWRIEPHEVRQ